MSNLAETPEPRPLASKYSLDLSLGAEEGSLVVRRAENGEGLAVIAADMGTLRDPYFWQAVEELVRRAVEQLRRAKR